jgi:hypothetical protein
MNRITARGKNGRRQNNIEKIIRNKMVKCKRRTTKRKPNSEGSVGSRGKRGRG